jgi:hypothetical protein
MRSLDRRIYLYAVVATVLENLRPWAWASDAEWRGILVSVPLVLVGTYLASTEPEEVRRRFHGTYPRLLLLAVPILVLVSGVSHVLTWGLLWGIAAGRAYQSGVWRTRSGE